MKSIRILLVDDHLVVREGLRKLISAEPDLQICGEAGNGWEALKLAKQTQPDVILMDVAMPGLNGLDATRRILREAGHGMKILVLSSYHDDDCVQEMVAAGVCGYVEKRTGAMDLLKAIREVGNGRRFFSSGVIRHVSSNGRSKPAKALTARELEALGLIARGFSNKEAAVEMGISMKTVEKHRQQVMNKLGIHDTAGLTRYALAKGIVSAEIGTPPLATSQNAGTAAPVLQPG